MPDVGMTGMGSNVGPTPPSLMIAKNLLPDVCFGRPSAWYNNFKGWYD
jgi:hypothetical protein